MEISKTAGAGVLKTLDESYYKLKERKISGSQDGR